MILPKLRSLNMVILAGFALVALPLIFAILLTNRYVDQLASESTAVVADSVRATRSSQMLLEHIASLERNARQYHVLGDPELLALYKSRHERLLTILSDLRNMPDSQTPKLRETADRLLSALENHPYQSAEIAAALQFFEILNSDAKALSENINKYIDGTLIELQIRGKTVQQNLYWQAAALIPLALLLAALFTMLIAGPIRQLGNAILQLGSGDMTRGVTVRGPLDLEALGRQLDWLRLRMIELEQEKNEFLSHISHELKTPLANIREGVELLTDGSVGALSGSQQEVVSILQSNSISLQKNIENLLNFSAWQNTKARLHYSQCGLRDIIDSVLKQHQLAIKRLALNISRNRIELRLYANRERIEIMLDNLISNAVKFSPPGGTIYIEAGQDSSYTDIHVADEGPGIPELEREQVFEAFYHGRQPQHSHMRGTGIGLAIVRECVRAHGGLVKILDGKYPGAHFVVRLPIQPK